jgi:hypothetical protein
MLTLIKYMYVFCVIQLTFRFYSSKILVACAMVSNITINLDWQHNCIIFGLCKMHLAIMVFFIANFECGFRKRNYYISTGFTNMQTTVCFRIFLHFLHHIWMLFQYFYSRSFLWFFTLLYYINMTCYRYD